MRSGTVLTWNHRSWWVTILKARLDCRSTLQSTKGRAITKADESTQTTITSRSIAVYKLFCFWNSRSKIKYPFTDFLCWARGRRSAWLIKTRRDEALHVKVSRKPSPSRDPPWSSSVRVTPVSILPPISLSISWPQVTAIMTIHKDGPFPKPCRPGVGTRDAYLLVPTQTLPTKKSWLV